jgi:hypothetical protein
MATVLVRTVKEHRYAGRRRQIGDVYDADARFLSMLRAMHYVETAEEAEPPKRKRTYKRRDLTAEE